MQHVWDVAEVSIDTARGWDVHHARGQPRRPPRAGPHTRATRPRRDACLGVSVPSRSLLTTPTLDPRYPIAADASLVHDLLSWAPTGAPSVPMFFAGISVAMNPGQTIVTPSGVTISATALNQHGGILCLCVSVSLCLCLCLSLFVFTLSLFFSVFLCLSLSLSVSVTHTHTHTHK